MFNHQFDIKIIYTIWREERKEEGQRWSMWQSKSFVLIALEYKTKVVVYIFYYVEHKIYGIFGL